MMSKKQSFDGVIQFKWSNPSDKKEGELYCVCCPPHDNNIPHPHRYSHMTDFGFKGHTSILNKYWDFVCQSFEMEGKKIRVTFEVLDD